jgi:iron complex outermembrane receptor protein
MVIERLILVGMYTDANGNIKYYDNETDNYRQDNYQLHFIHSFSNKLNVNVTGHYTKGKGYYEQYKQGEALKRIITCLM